MKRGKSTIAAAIVLMALPPAWYWGSPWWTLWRIREAARAGDVARVGAYVDFAALATQADAGRKAALSALVGKVRPESPGRREFLASLKRALAQDPKLGFSELQSWLRALPAAPAAFGSGGASGYEPCIRHKGLNGFELRDRRASEQSDPVATFRREGLGWRLVGISFIGQ